MKKGLRALLLAGLLFLLSACGEPASNRKGEVLFDVTASSSEQAESMIDNEIFDQEEPLAPEKNYGAEQDAAMGGSAEESKANISSAAELPHFSFVQGFPLELNYKSASFQLLNASITEVYEENDKIIFTLSLTSRRQADSLAGEKSFAVRIRWYDQSGNQIHTTTAATTAAVVGKTGYGSSVIAVDKINGDYLVAFEELQ